MMHVANPSTRSKNKCASYLNFNVAKLGADRTLLCVLIKEMHEAEALVVLHATPRHGQHSVGQKDVINRLRKQIIFTK